MVEIDIGGDAASMFRRHFNIDSAQQASDALANADALFASEGNPWAGDADHAPNRETFDWAAQQTKRRFDEGKYKDGDLAKARQQKQGEDLSGSARHAAGDSHQWRAICTDPDYCKVGNAIVPFDSSATLGSQVTASPNVKVQGVPIYRVGDIHKGVQGDAGSHIVAGTSLGGGHVKFLDGQNNVKANGIPIVRQDSACLVNCNSSGAGGAAGKVVTTQRNAQTSAGTVTREPNDHLQALLDAEADQRSFGEKTSDFFSSAWDSTKRIATASYNDPKNTGIGVLKGLGNLPTDLWNTAVLASKYTGAPMGMSPAIQAKIMETAALQAHQAGDIVRANELASQATELMSSGYAEDLFTPENDAQQGGSIASILFPVGTVLKGAGAAAKVVRGAKTAEEVAKTTRTVDAAGDVTRAEDLAADAGKPGPGVHVKPYTNPKHRPKYGRGQVDEVWDNARRPDGKVYDQNTGEELLWDKSKTRAGQWDMGHMPGHEYRRLHQRYMSGEIDLDEFLSEYRNPANYRPESVSANRGHAFEKPD